MATARLTIGSLLGTVTTAAETVTSTLNVVSLSVGMANAYVAKAAHEQQHRHRNDAELFTSRLVIEGAQAETEMNLEVIKYCKKSDEHQKLFAKAYEKYAKLHNLKLEGEENVEKIRVHAA